MTDNGTISRDNVIKDLITGASQGSAAAQYQLAMICNKGDAFAADQQVIIDGTIIEEPARITSLLLEKAADQGHAMAAHQLGLQHLMGEYHDGEKLKGNRASAIEYFGIAAENGDQGAVAYLLGIKDALEQREAVSDMTERQKEFGDANVIGIIGSNGSLTHERRALDNALHRLEEDGIDIQNDVLGFH